MAGHYIDVQRASKNVFCVRQHGPVLRLGRQGAQRHLNSAYSVLLSKIIFRLLRQEP